MIAIETNRLVLRQHSIDELTGYTKLWSTTTPGVSGAPGTPPLSYEEAWARLLRFVGHWSVFGFGPFIVVDRATNSAVGEVGFAYFHRGHGAGFDGSPEAMWKIDHHSQGKGIASEAVLAAIEWFDHQQFAKRTVCMIDPQNTASLRIAAHFGFDQFTSTTYRNNPVLLFLWFSIRVLLMYRFRQSVTPLTEQVSTPDRITTTWHRVEVEPRQEARDFDSMDFFGRVDDFIAQAAPRLATCRDQSGLLHAAAWGYAASFNTTVLDAQLTDRVEAIERLVAVYEKTFGLDRDRVSREKWKPIKSALKKTIDDSDIDEELAGHLKRGFASSPPLTLQERIERMAAMYPDQWDQDGRGLLKGLNNMITARNAIVHGRLVDNIDRLAVERLRARVIFEKLFMSFFGCGEYHSSGYAQLSISSFERRLAGNNDG